MLRAAVWIMDFLAVCDSCSADVHYDLRTAIWYLVLLPVRSIGRKC